MNTRTYWCCEDALCSHCKQILSELCVHQQSLASAWQQLPGSSNGTAQCSSGFETLGRTGSLGGAGSLQAPTAQPRCFVVTTGDVVVRSSSGPLEQPEAPPQVWCCCTTCDQHRLPIQSSCHHTSGFKRLFHRQLFCWFPCVASPHPGTRHLSIQSLGTHYTICCAPVAESLSQRVRAAATHAIRQAGKPGCGAYWDAGSPSGSRRDPPA